MEEVAAASPATLPPIPQHILIKHEGHVIQVSSSNDDDDDDEFFHNRKNNDTGNNGKPPLPVNLPLVDEIDLQQCLISPPTPTWHASAIQGVVIGKEQLEVMCNHSSHHGRGAQSTIDGGGGVGTGFQACPCCRRFIQRGTTSHTVATDADVVMKDDNDTSGPMIRPRPALLEGTNTSNEHPQQRSEEDQREEHQPKSTSTLTNLWNNLTQANSSGINIAAPPLATGDQLQDYTITETIVQGWLYKKGTGDDWAGQRWWKPRWVTLAVSAEDIIFENYLNLVTNMIGSLLEWKQISPIELLSDVYPSLLFLFVISLPNVQTVPYPHPVYSRTVHRGYPIRPVSWS